MYYFYICIYINIFPPEAEDEAIHYSWALVREGGDAELSSERGTLGLEGTVTNLTDSKKDWLPRFEFPFHHLLFEWSYLGTSLGPLSFLIFKIGRTLYPLQGSPWDKLQWGMSNTQQSARHMVRLTSTSRCHSY